MVDDVSANAYKDKELDKYPLWLEVIRRFIRSNDFKTPSGLELLALILSEVMQNKEICSMSLELSKKIDKQKATKPRYRNTEGQQVEDSEDCDKDEKDSIASDSAVLNSKIMESSRTDEDGEEASKSWLNNSDSRSNSEVSTPAEEKTKEDVELDRLLRLVSNNPCPVRQRKNHGENRTPKPECKSQEKSTPILPKPKEPNLSLMDYINFQYNDEPGEMITNKVTTKMADDDFVKEFNNKVKKLFLFSSESCQSNISESEREDETPKGNRKKNKVVKKQSTSRKTSSKKWNNDLRKYQISSSEDEDEGKAKEEKTPEENEKRESQKEADDKECNNRSDSENSVEVLLEPSDSESEIVQVYETPLESIPKKGRKNINRILDVKNLQLETKVALKTENERKRRLRERGEQFKKLCENNNYGLKLVLDFDPVTMKELVVVDENLSKYLKPHQREGVRFMWNCCFENLSIIEKEKGSGCVLAHCMGLGKTLQVITLVHSVLVHSIHIKTVLIVCPLGTVRNWCQEFKMWMRDVNNPIIPFFIGTARNRRHDQIREWSENGGVLITSYEMFRTLVKIDGYSVFYSWLVDPGPDIVICDEGHLMKNPNSKLSKCMSKMRTLRRIVLTGTPLQNNLIEYYCMVQFVKPNLLGTKKEFMNRFVNPITNGQFENSTQQDAFIMKQRSHVLHTLLQSFVQRLGYNVLEPLLPEKQEFVISIALTKTQETLYRLCLKMPLMEGRGLLWDFHWFHKVWTHPLTVKRYFEQTEIKRDVRESWEKFIPEHEYDCIRSSNKLQLLFSILQKCHQIGDKVLVFSQSLYTLGLIENFLLKSNLEYEKGRQTKFADRWVYGEEYFKLTGSVKSKDREKYCEKFSSSQRARLFLISTKAGGLGINLVGANRVVLFDASWNPSHDLQSIFRVYRMGQKKPCYIYRFLAAATMEEKIYRRQITKLSLAHRILDEHQIERHYSSHNLLELYTYDPLPKSEWKVPKIPKDEVFTEILSNNRDVIVGYHEHNSLLENKEEEELTEEERQAAWANYEQEKSSPQKKYIDLNFFSALQHPSPETAGRVGTDTPKISARSKWKRNEDRWRERSDYVGSKNLLELGDSFGLRPFSNENMEVYRKRVEGALHRVFPWGTPKVIIQGGVGKEE